MAKMIKRVPMQSVVVHRPNPDDEKKPLRVTPEIGKPFDFTEEEVEQLKRSSPGALSDKAIVDLTEDGRDGHEEDEATKEAAKAAASTKEAKAAVKPPSVKGSVKDEGL